MLGFDFWAQLVIVLVALFYGARKGGMALGLIGGIGLIILVFGFHLKPGKPPVDVILTILSVICASAALQAAGGLDCLLQIAEKMLRKHPRAVCFLAPYLCWFLALLCGTGHVVYTMLPIIYDVAIKNGIRPERPMAIAVIASQQAITASPISAATVALLSMLTGYHLSLLDILMISIPSTIVGVLLGALYSLRVGRDLEVDPEYLRRLEAGEFDEAVKGAEALKSPWKASVSVGIFVLATVLIVLFGSIEELRRNGDTMLQMPSVIEILMLSAAALILLITRTNGIKAAQGSVFSAGMQAVVAIFGIAWMGDTFLNGNMTELRASIEGVVTSMPWLFGIALFVMSILLYSQAATVRALMPLGIALGISPWMLVALFPAVNGYFFIPNYPTVVAAINFDRTGTTRIGKYVLNHSFMMPGLIATIGAMLTGLLLIQFLGR